MKLYKKAQKYADMFTTTKRGEDNITILKEDASRDLRDSLFEAHGKMLRDDWTYSTYYSLLQSVADYEVETIDKLEDVRGEIVDSCVDIYTSDLTSWLNDHNYNIYYLEEAQKELGPIEDGFKLLASAQYMAIDEIMQEIINLLSK